VRTFLKYWAPVIVWLGMIFAASTDLMSAHHTSSFIGPILQWMIPDIAPETIRAIQFTVRKAAHVAEYAILAGLLLRALRSGAQSVRWTHAVLALVVASSYAALDEYHQSFVASRTGSPRDVLIDACGAVIGVGVCSWLISRRRRKSQPAARLGSDDIV